MLFSNVWKRNNLRIISSGHPADVARGSGRVKFFSWTESLDWDEPCPVLWASADSHKPTCETKQIPRGNFQCRGFCLSEAFTSRGWFCYRSTSVAVLKHFQSLPGLMEKYPLVVLLPAAAVNCFFTFSNGFMCPLSRCDVLELFLWFPVFHWTCYVSRVGSVSAAHRYLLWIKRPSEKQELGGWLQRELLRVLFTSS